MRTERLTANELEAKRDALAAELEDLLREAKGLSKVHREFHDRRAIESTTIEVPQHVKDGIRRGLKYGKDAADPNCALKHEWWDGCTCGVIVGMIIGAGGVLAMIVVTRWLTKL